MAALKVFKETFTLVWLDASADTDAYREIHIRLGTELCPLTSFTNVKECQTYLEKHQSVDKFVLIVSGQLGSKLVPLIHDLPNIETVYVYCAWKENGEEWSRKFEKVRFISYDIRI
jgi:hypothetical protein